MQTADVRVEIGVHLHAVGVELQLGGVEQRFVRGKARHDLTLRSIKREIAAERDVAYWLDKAYTHLDSGLLTEDDIAEVEALAQAYYDALDAKDKADQELEENVKIGA